MTLYTWEIRFAETGEENFLYRDIITVLANNFKEAYAKGLGHISHNKELNLELISCERSKEIYGK